MSRNSRVKYMENAVLERQPHTADPQEVRIRKILEEELISTSWAKEAVAQMRSVQEDYLKQSLKQANSSKILDNYQASIEKLWDISKARLISGEEVVGRLDRERALIIVTNHLGLAKITRIPTRKLGFSIPLEEIEPFPIRVTAGAYAFDRLERFHEVAIRLPHPLDKIQKDSRVVIVEPQGTGRTAKLIEDVSNILKREKEGLFVMYPEGGTSGKRNNGGPYDLDKFHSGSFAVGATLEIPVVPVCQILDPEEGLKVGVLEPLYLKEKDLDYIGEIAQNTQRTMQEFLKK